MKSSELGILEIVVIHCSVFYLNEALKETKKKFSDLIAWAHSTVDKPCDLEIPAFASKESKILIKNNLNQWFHFNDYIKCNRPNVPLKSILHSS